MLWGLDRETLLYLVGAIAVSLAAVLYLEFARPGRPAQPQRWRKRIARPVRWPIPDTPVGAPGPVSPFERRPRDAADQLRIVMAADFNRQRLLLQGEERVFRCVEETVREVRPRYRVMAQVSLGEVLKSPEKDAFLAVNCKRVDLLIVDEDFQPIVAIEYQGGGHHQSDAAARDAVKKEALRKAGVRYEEVRLGDRPGDLKDRIRRWLDRPGGGGAALPLT